MTRHTLCWHCGNTTSPDTRPRLCADCWPIVARADHIEREATR